MILNFYPGEIVPVTTEEQWTTSKKKVNHKTRQIETRVKRQIVLEDGKVIADSGNQITSRTKEDSHVEEDEHEGKPVVERCLRGPSKLDDYIEIPDSERVVEEEVERHQITKERKEEQMQYHDESSEQLTGFEAHKRALLCPQSLLRVSDNSDEEDPDRKDGKQGALFSKPPRGKLVNYDYKGHRVHDADEQHTLHKKDVFGKIHTERHRTHHHEVVEDDERPDDRIVDPNVRQQRWNESNRTGSGQVSALKAIENSDYSSEQFQQQHQHQQQHLNQIQSTTTTNPYRFPRKIRNVPKEDAGVQASFTSDESSDEEITRGHNQSKHFYFGERDKNQTSKFDRLTDEIRRVHVEEPINVKIDVTEPKTGSYFSHPYVPGDCKPSRWSSIVDKDRPGSRLESSLAENKLSRTNTFTRLKPTSNANHFGVSPVWPKFSSLQSPSELRNLSKVSK